jgi:hypothetical protein
VLKLLNASGNSDDVVAAAAFDADNGDRFVKKSLTFTYSTCLAARAELIHPANKVKHQQQHVTLCMLLAKCHALSRNLTSTSQLQEKRNHCRSICASNHVTVQTIQVTSHAFHAHS